MREIYGFLRLASRLANPFGHLSQVRTQVLVLQTCVDLRQLASPFGQGFRFTTLHIWSYLGLALLPNVESKFCQYTKHRLQSLMQTPKTSQARSHDSVCSRFPSALGLTKLVVFEDNKNEAVFLVHKFRDLIRTFHPLSALPPLPVYLYYIVPSFVLFTHHHTLVPPNPLPFLPLPHTFTMPLFTPKIHFTQILSPYPQFLPPHRDLNSRINSSNGIL